LAIISSDLSRAKLQNHRVLVVTGWNPEYTGEHDYKGAENSGDGGYRAVHGNFEFTMHGLDSEAQEACNKPSIPSTQKVH
jgi:hypothetical protein